MTDLGVAGPDKGKGGKFLVLPPGYKGDMPTTENGGYGVRQEIVLPTSTIGFVGGNIACPHKPDRYLRILYGDFEEVEYTYVDAAAAETRRQADIGQ